MDRHILKHENDEIMEGRMLGKATTGRKHLQVLHMSQQMTERRDVSNL